MQAYFAMYANEGPLTPAGRQPVCNCQDILSEVSDVRASNVSRRMCQVGEGERDSKFQNRNWTRARNSSVIDSSSLYAKNKETDPRLQGALSAIGAMDEELLNPAADAQKRQCIPGCSSSLANFKRYITQ
jgi:hypothetical protein